jgi:hypothetical protein
MRCGRFVRVLFGGTWTIDFRFVFGPLLDLVEVSRIGEVDAIRFLVRPIVGHVAFVLRAMKRQTRKPRLRRAGLRQTEPWGWVAKGRGSAYP